MKKWIFPFILFSFLLFGCDETAKPTTPELPLNTTIEIPPTTATISPLPTITPGPSTPTQTLNPTVQIALTLYKQTQEANDVKIKATQHAMDGFRKTFSGMCD